MQANNKSKNNEKINVLLPIIVLLVLLLLTLIGTLIFKGTHAGDLVGYKITFNINDENANLDGENELYAYNGYSNLYISLNEYVKSNIPIATKEGYEFTGWWTSSEDGELVIYPSGDIVQDAIDGYIDDGKWNLSEDTVLYAQYLENGRKLTYNCSQNGGYTNNIYMVYNSNDEVNLTKICKKSDDTSNNLLSMATAWDFIGWNTDVSATTKLDSFEMPDEDTQLYAIYKKEEVVLSALWNENGATLSQTVPRSCTLAAVYNNEVQATSCVVTPPTITPAEGYIVIGWNNDSNATVNSTAYNPATNELTLVTLSGNEIVSGEMLTPGDSNEANTWYAITAPRMYEITLNPIKGVVTGSTLLQVKNGEGNIYIDGNLAESIPVATRYGYTFDGWYTEEVDGVKIIDRFGNIQNYEVDGYIANGEWNLNDDIVLYAHYNMADGFNADDDVYNFTESDEYEVVENKMILNIFSTGIDFNTLSESIVTNGEVILLDKNDNELLGNIVLKTGYKIKFIFDENEVIYKIAVKGDVLGTGELSWNNAKEIAKHILNNNEFTGEEYLLAADYNNDGYIKMNDVVKVLMDITKD